MTILPLLNPSCFPTWVILLDESWAHAVLVWTWRLLASAGPWKILVTTAPGSKQSEMTTKALLSFLRPSTAHLNHFPCSDKHKP